MQSKTMTHEQCWENLPWVVNGRLSEVERQRVLAHAADCTECREELRQQRELHAHLRGTPADEVPEVAWDRLLARIDAESQPQSEPSEAAMTVPQPASRRWWIAAVWVQGVAIAVLLGALLMPDAGSNYVTLSAPAQVPPQGSIRVVFAPNASLNRVNNLLQEIDGEIVAGPSEAGVYTVALLAADPALAIAVLRQHEEVLFAESTTAVGVPRR